MEEQLVSFETAILAKKKKFDIPVKYGVYGKKMKLSQNFGWEKNQKLELTNWNAKTKQKKGSQATSVPTQSLLQKWLREEKKIFVCTDISPISGNYEYFIHHILDHNMETNEFAPLIKESNGYDFISYEDALEEGLKEALKLI